MSRWGADEGLTLVELLVAMAVLGVLMTAVAGALRYGIRAFETEGRQLAGADEVMVAQRFLRRQLERAYPRIMGDDAVSARVDFHGSPAALAFQGPSPAALAAGGRSRVALDHADGTLRLRIGDAERKMLLSDVAAVRFSYFGATRPGEPVRWSDRWVEAMMLPDLVRLQVTFPDGDPRIWPEFVVAPRITADVGCVFDSLTKFCRGRGGW